MIKVPAMPALGVLLALLCGCGSVEIQKPYTKEELRQECQRKGGWWRDLAGGFCEYRGG